MGTLNKMPTESKTLSGSYNDIWKTDMSLLFLNLMESLTKIVTELIVR